MAIIHDFIQSRIGWVVSLSDDWPATIYLHMNGRDIASFAEALLFDWSIVTASLLLIGQRSVGSKIWLGASGGGG